MQFQAHACRFGMTRQTAQGAISMTKPIGFPTSPPAIADEFDMECSENHERVMLQGAGRSKQAHVSGNCLHGCLQRVEDPDATRFIGIVYVG